MSAPGPVPPEQGRSALQAAVAAVEAHYLAEELDGVDQARAEDEAAEPDLDGGEEAYWAGVAEGEWTRRNLGYP